MKSRSVAEGGPTIVASHCHVNSSIGLGQSEAGSVFCDNVSEAHRTKKGRRGVRGE